MSQTVLTAKADYTFSIVDGVVCIVDQDGQRSVTNDVEAVIAGLAAAGVDLASMPVIYRDTMGTWDQLAVENGRFADFRLLNESDRGRAIERAKESKHSFGQPVGNAPAVRASPYLLWAVELLDRAAAERSGWAVSKPEYRNFYEQVAQQIKDRADQVRSWAAGAKWREERGEETPAGHLAYVRRGTREFLITAGYPDAAERCRDKTAGFISSLDELQALASQWALIDPFEDTRHPDDAAALARNACAAGLVTDHWITVGGGAKTSGEASQYIEMLEAARSSIFEAIALHSQRGPWQRRFGSVMTGGLYTPTSTRTHPDSEASPLRVCKSAAGYYLGTLTPEGLPNSRESAEYWDKKEEAEAALSGRAPWTPRNAIEHFPAVSVDTAALYLAALRVSGTSEAAFGAAFSRLTADPSITTATAATLARAYIGQDGDYGTPAAAFGAIETAFYDQRAAAVQRQAAQTAERGGGR